MKTEELMVGDLVQVAKDVCIKQGTIVKVRSIDGDNSFPEKGLKGCATCEPLDDRTLSGGVWVKYLAPIIITKEILDNNGMIHNVSRQSGDVFELSIEGELAYIQVKCRYVHEVQHALRICGFMDGANNFKVN